MKKRKAFSTKWAVAILCCVCISCTKNDSGIPTTTPTPTPVPTPQPVATLLQLPAGWKLSASLNSAMPTGIQVYQFDSVYHGKTIKAWCVAFDTKNTNLEVKPLLATTTKKTSDFYNQEPGTKYVAINGGFFGSNNLLAWLSTTILCKRLI